MSTLTVKELAAPTGFDLKIASGETLDLKSQGTVTMPTGSLLQTKHMYTDSSNGQSVTSTSFIDITGLSLTITPSSSSNKVLITTNVHNYITSHASDGWNACDYRIAKTVGGTTTTVFDSFKNSGGGHGYTAGAYVRDDETRFMWVTPVHFLDSPNTTSEITYKIQVRVKDSNFTCTFNSDYCRSSILLQEVQG